MDFRVRRVRRTDLRAIVRLLEATGLPVPPGDRAGLRRFRNIVADLGCDFDVAESRNGVRGFVHLTYSRDLRIGNRAQILALVPDSPEVRGALLNAATQRAIRRRCHDLTVAPGPWSAALRLDELPPGWGRVDGCMRIDLAAERGAE